MSDAEKTTYEAPSPETLAEMLKAEYWRGYAAGIAAVQPKQYGAPYPAYPWGPQIWCQMGTAR